MWQCEKDISWGDLVIMADENVFRNLWPTGEQININSRTLRQQQDADKGDNENDVIFRNKLL